ncbi:MAG: hypothetical protein HN991_00755 [Candidatus Jacksonbacteria bacterium]|nr:hypothetical protein [Candidatus Jacksonbacteria bacterium]
MRKLFYIMVLLVMITGISAGSFGVANAALNYEINYQGKLTNTSDIAVADDSYNIRFDLCTGATCAAGGDPIWTETHCYSPDSGATCDGTGSDQMVPTVNGLFSVMIGSVSGTSLSTIDFNQTLYLEVDVGGASASSPSWETLTPRKVLGVVPSAFIAYEATNLGGKTWAAPDAIGSGTPAAGTFTTGIVTTLNGLTVTTTSSGVLTIPDSTIAFSGDNDLTITTTGSTNVTVPTSGTLAILGANTFTANQTITKADPSIIFDVTTATDTDFWIGVQDDAGGDNDDTFAIGDGTSPGTNTFLSIDTSGNIYGGTSYNLGTSDDTNLLGFAADILTINGAIAGATTIDASTDFTVGGTVITNNTVTDDGTFVINASTATSFSDDPITNVGDIALDSLSSDGGAAITITPTTDTHFSNATGVVIGNTAQVTASSLGELQLLGTAAADSNQIIGQWSAAATAGGIDFLKSRHATIGSNTIVQDNDKIGEVRFFPADGVDFATLAAQFSAEVDDASPAAGDVGMAFVWEQMAGGAAALAETMRISATGNLIIGPGEQGTSAATGNTLRGANLSGGTNQAGADLTIAAGAGTGTGDVGQIIFQTPRVGGSGTTPHTVTTLMTLDEATVTMAGDLLVDGGDIGVTSDSNLLGLAADILTINGAIAGATTIDASTDFTVGGTVITDNTITDDGTLVIASTTATSFSDGNITNAGDISLDSLSSDASGLVTITPTTDTIFSNGTGVVIGNTAQVTASSLGELQLLGTAAADSNQIIGQWSAAATAGGIDFLKSRHATIGSNTIVQDDDKIGEVRFLPADGVDFATLAAQFSAEVDDATPAAGDVGTAFVWDQMPGGGNPLAETMRLSASGELTVAGNVDIEGYGVLGNGIALDPRTTLRVQRTYETASTAPAQLRVGGVMTYTSTGDVYQGLYVSSQVTINSGNTHTNVATVAFNEPQITLTSGTITNASTLYINNDPTEGDNNYSIFVDGGVSRFDGNILADGGSIGLTADTDLIGLASGVATVRGNLDMEGYMAIGNAQAVNANQTLIVNRDFELTSNSIGSAIDTRGLITVPSGNTKGGHYFVNIVPDGYTLNSDYAHTTIATLRLTEPKVTENGTAAVTNTAVIYTASVADEGTNNYAIWADTGEVRFDGIVNIGAPASAGTDALCWDGSGQTDITDCSGTPADFAEEYGTRDSSIEAGDIVMIDPEREAEKVIQDDLQGSKAWIVKTDTAYSSNSLGIVSTEPGQVIGENFEEHENPRPVALSGRVPVKVSGENGSIAIGDMITSSPIAGVGMKAVEPGRVVGMALESFDSTEEQGSIHVFVNSHWFGGNEEYLDTEGSILLALGVVFNKELKTLTINADGNAEKIEFVGDVTITGNLEVESAVVQNYTFDCSWAECYSAKKGMAVYISGDSTVSLASAASTDTAPAIGLIVTDEINDGDEITVAIGGVLGGFEDLESGKRYFLSSTTGELTQGQDGDLIQVVAIAQSETELLIQPALDYFIQNSSI